MLELSSLSSVMFLLSGYIWIFRKTNFKSNFWWLLPISKIAESDERSTLPKLALTCCYFFGLKCRGLGNWCKEHWWNFLKFRIRKVSSPQIHCSNLHIHKHEETHTHTHLILMLRYTYGYKCHVLQDKSIYCFQEEVGQHQRVLSSHLQTSYSIFRKKGEKINVKVIKK